MNEVKKELKWRRETAGFERKWSACGLQKYITVVLWWEWRIDRRARVANEGLKNKDV